ncbi:hypothetical protein NQ315_007045 [Exocentrus adspersus]|uniref:Glucosylceramidase n=1 Tax=Exocentrus adspersus TaxID=1586481 RepID=A0AAV8WCM5_9CUCU|nr:hypothetical protein NQ315_007045 [Exocentrus adspersus]
MIIVTLLLLSSSLVAVTLSQSCNIRDTDEGTVCVCNAKYCDSVPSLDVSTGKYQVYSTSKTKLGFESTSGDLTEDGTEIEGASAITLNSTTKYQTIIGFGGAFTDSTGINIKSLPEDVQSKLMESYFGKSGVEYSLCRVPIGGTDFSTRGYSYDDVENDTALEHFALQEDDFDYKIPFIQQANELRGAPIQLFASAWTAPPWMKTNNDWAGTGFLKEEFYQLWADYILKFFEEYAKQNVTFWGMTTQNEPIDGFVPNVILKINDMGWSPSQMNKWIGENLGPTIRNSKYKDLKIMIHDDSRITLPLLLPIINNETTMKYADGAAVHWYTDFLIPSIALDLLKSDKEGWFFISSEACAGSLKVLGFEEPVEKGSWRRAASYIDDIVDNLEQGAGGWVDWNMVLDETGGPTYINNTVDSPILVNATSKEFYKQPMFYALGHFSKFVIPGSVRIEASVGEDLEDVRVVAFERPDNVTAVVIYNSGSDEINLQLRDSGSQSATIKIKAMSINTVLFYEK